MLEEEYKQKIKDFVIEHKIGFVVVAVISLFSLISQTWFRGNNTIGIGDNFFTIDSLKFLNTLDSSWRSNANLGSPEFGLQFLFPYALVYYPLNILGFSTVTAAKIWMYLSLFFPGIFMYLFLDEYFKDKVSYVIKLVVALFYIFNPVTMLTPFGASLSKFPVYLAAPALSYLLLKFFSEIVIYKKTIWGVLFVLSLGMLSAAFGNVAEIASLVLILFSLAVFELFSSDKKIKHFVYILLILLFSFLINFWWINSSFYSQYLTRAEFIAGAEKFNPPQTHIFDAMRLFGFWALNASDRGLPYFSFGQYYYKPFGVLISYVIPILVFSSLIFINFVTESGKLFKKILLFIFLGFLGIFLIKGIRPPFGGWYLHMFTNYGLFRVFREPYSKFSLLTLFSFTVVLGFSLQFIAGFLKSYLKRSELYVGALFLILTIAIAYPMFTGSFVPVLTNGPRKQMVVKTPQYWLDLYRFSQEKEFTARVLTLPENSYYRKSYIWERGFVGNPYDLYLTGDKISKPITLKSFGDVLITELYKSIREYNEQKNEKYLVKFVNLARLLNVGYLLQMNDFDWVSYGEEYESLSTENMESFFTDLEQYFDKYKSFGRFTSQYLSIIPHIRGGDGIYRQAGGPTADDYLNNLQNKEALIVYSINKSFELPLIYIPNMVVFSQSVGDMVLSLESSEYTAEYPMFLNQTPPFIPETEEIQTINFEKLSDSRYKVAQKKPITTSIYLVFNTAFDKEWRLARDCNWLGCKEISSAPHFVANYFANGWIVNPRQTEEVDNLYIFHSSESRLKVGLLVSFGSLLIMFGTLILIWVKTKKK